MTLSTIKEIIACLEGNRDPQQVQSVLKLLKEEVMKSEDKKAQNHNFYAQARAGLIKFLTERPVFQPENTYTAKEIYENIHSFLPDGFSQSKMQYAIREYWGDIFFKVAGSVPAKYHIQYPVKEG